MNNINNINNMNNMNNMSNFKDLNNRKLYTKPSNKTDLNYEYNFENGFGKPTNTSVNLNLIKYLILEFINNEKYLSKRL